MPYLNRILFFLIALFLTACPLDKEQVPKLILPEKRLEQAVSIIKVPLELKTRYLKRAFHQEFSNPIIEGETGEFKMRLSGKEKKSNKEKNFFKKVTDPLLEWVDKTFLVSGNLGYKVALGDYDFWFEKDRFFADITLDLNTEINVKNGISILGKNAQLNGHLKCPMQARLVLEGKIELTNGARINVLLDDKNALIKFQKICSSEAIKELDFPALLKPVLDPIKKRIVKTINMLITKQLQQLLNGQGELLSFQSQIDKIGSTLAQPVELMEGAWLVPNVKTVFVSPPNGTGVGFENQLELVVGVKAFPKVLFSNKKPAFSLAQEIDFAVEQYDAQTTIYVHAQIPLEDAAQQLQTFLKDYIDNNYAQHGYSVGAVKIYPSEEKAVIAVDFLKVKNQKQKATIYLWGLPKYDMEKQEVYLDELAFTAKSKDIILKFAQWIMNPKILKQLEKNARFEVSDQLKEVEEQLNFFKVEEELGTLKGKFDYINIDNIRISESHFNIHLQIRGELEFDLKW